MDHITIGKVAKSAGLGIETVRYYEREGLIRPAARTGSNYRIYRKEAIDRLQFYQAGQESRLHPEGNQGVAGFPP